MNAPTKEWTLDELLERVPTDIPAEKDPGELPEFLRRELPVDGTPDKEEQEDPAE